MENSIRKCLIDANVLFSVPKRDLIVSLNRAGVIQAYWTGTILAETQRALEKRFFHQTSNSLRSKRDALRVLNNLNLYSPTSLLVGDYSNPPDFINLPYPNDNHVLFAAIESQAQFIVTDNLQDFPESALNDFRIEVRTADRLISEVIDEHPLISNHAVSMIQERLKNPPIDIDELLEI